MTEEKFQCEACGSVTTEPDQWMAHAHIDVNLSHLVPIRPNDDHYIRTSTAISGWLCGTCTVKMLAVLGRRHEDIP